MKCFVSSCQCMPSLSIGFGSAGMILMIATSLLTPMETTSEIEQLDEAIATNITGQDTETFLKSFEHVWTTIRDKHWDKNLGGLDWSGIREEYRPKVEAAQDANELDALLNDMLGRLKQSHTGIIPSKAYEVIGNTSTEDKPQSQDGSIGVEFRLIEGKPTVWRIDPQMSAYATGVRPGWILVKVDDKPIADRIREAGESTESLLSSEMLQRILVERFSNGPIGHSSQFVWVGGTDELQETELEFQEPFGKLTKFGNLPAMVVRCTTRKVDDVIPVFELNCFFDPPHVFSQFQQLIENNQASPGLIIDLRGNVGGLGFMAMSIGGWLTNQSGLQLGVMSTRNGNLNFTLQPRETVFEGRVAVLVDELSISTSEILAGGLQDNSLARIFGRKTPGMALPSSVERLPHGAGFQYPFANYHSADGQSLEGYGVTPDELIELRRADLLLGHDPDIEAAVNWIRGK